MFKKVDLVNELQEMFEELQDENYIIDIDYLEKKFFNKHKVLLEFIKVYNKKENRYEKWYFRNLFGLTREYCFFKESYISKNKLYEEQEKFINNLKNTNFFIKPLYNTKNFYIFKWYSNLKNIDLKQIINNKILLLKLKKEIEKFNHLSKSSGCLFGLRGFLSEMGGVKNQYLHYDYMLNISFQKNCFDYVIYSFIYTHNNIDFYFNIVSDNCDISELKQTCFLYALNPEYNLNNQWVFIPFSEFIKINYDDLKEYILPKKHDFQKLCITKASGFYPITYFNNNQQKFFKNINN
jgi:hypothetical protein